MAFNEKSLREKQRKEIIDYDLNIHRKAFDIEKTAVKTMKDDLKPPSELDKRASYDIATSVENMQKMITELINNLTEYKDQLYQTDPDHFSLHDNDSVHFSNRPDTPEMNDMVEERDIFPVEPQQNHEGERVPYEPSFFDRISRPDTHTYRSEHHLDQKELRNTFRRIPNQINGIISIWNNMILNIDHFANKNLLSQRDLQSVYDKIDSLIEPLEKAIISLEDPEMYKLISYRTKENFKKETADLLTILEQRIKNRDLRKVKYINVHYPVEEKSDNDFDLSTYHTRPNSPSNHGSDYGSDYGSNRGSDYDGKDSEGLASYDQDYDQDYNADEIELQRILGKILEMKNYDDESLDGNDMIGDHMYEEDIDLQRILEDKRLLEIEMGNFDDDNDPDYEQRDALMKQYERLSQVYEEHRGFKGKEMMESRKTTLLRLREKRERLMGALSQLREDDPEDHDDIREFLAQIEDVDKEIVENSKEKIKRENRGEHFTELEEDIMADEESLNQMIQNNDEQGLRNYLPIVVTNINKKLEHYKSISRKENGSESRNARKMISSLEGSKDRLVQAFPLESAEFWDSYFEKTGSDEEGNFIYSMSDKFMGDNESVNLEDADARETIHFAETRDKDVAFDSVIDDDFAQRNMSGREEMFMSAADRKRMLDGREVQIIEDSDEEFDISQSRAEYLAERIERKTGFSEGEKFELQGLYEKLDQTDKSIYDENNEDRPDASRLYDLKQKRLNYLNRIINLEKRKNGSGKAIGNGISGGTHHAIINENRFKPPVYQTGFIPRNPTRRTRKFDDLKNDPYLINSQPKDPFIIKY